MIEKCKKWIAGYPVRKVLIGTVVAGLLTILVMAAYVGINYGSQVSQVYQEHAAMREQWSTDQWNTVQRSEEDAEEDNTTGSAGWGRSRFGRSDRYGRTSKWHGQASSYGMEQGWKNVLGFGTTDYVLFAGAGIIGIILCLLFQLTLIVYALQLAWKTGMNPFVCGLLVLFLRIAGVIALWVYLGFRHRCASCGRIQKKDEMYCLKCGTVQRIKCPECQELQGSENNYCSGCGKDLQ